MSTTLSTNNQVVTRFRGGADELAAVTGSTPYDADKVDAARDQAYGLIVSYIGTRFDLGHLADHPAVAALLRECELDGVEYFLWSAARSAAPERVVKKWEATVAWLRDVATGKATLPSDGTMPATDQAGTVAEVSGPGRVFTRDDMEGLI